MPHTPGPWMHGAKKKWTADEGKARLVPDTGFFIGPEGKGLDIAEVHCTASQDPETSLANACLLAAAPDLLAACKEAVIAFEFEAPVGNSAIELLKAAIAKAEGY